MNFDFSENEKSLCQMVKGLFDQDSRASLDQLETGGSKEIRGILSHWMRALGQAGYLALGLEHGKNNVGLLAAQETLASISPSLFLAVEVSTRVFGRLVATYGGPDQQTEILPALKEGRLIGAVGLSEEGMNIENNLFNTEGIRRGDGLQVSGSKWHVVNGPIADYIAVAGKEGDRVAFFMIQKETEGLLIGERLPTLGYNGAVISPISLKGCFVLSSDVLGPFEGSEPLKAVRIWENQVLTAASLGLMQCAMDAAVDYAKTHHSGGKPIIAYQEVGFKLAEMLTLLQTARLLAYRAAWMTDVDDKEAGVLTHCAKVFCAESVEAVTSHALQVLGGQGYRLGNAAEKGYRNAKYLQIAGTSSEISRMKIGDALLERNW
ncbi:MAG: acyl-CoA dehydrogenase family protein [Desulfobacteraceae bacterium]|jgi:alkylation response protein AidB-like acyl-CoA dehydrogenase